MRVVWKKRDVPTMTNQHLDYQTHYLMEKPAFVSPTVWALLGKRHTRQANISSVINSHQDTIEFWDVPFRVCLSGFILHVFFVGVYVYRTLWGAAPAAAVASGFVAPLRLTFFSNRAHLLSLPCIQSGLGLLVTLFFSNALFKIANKRDYFDGIY